MANNHYFDIIFELLFIDLCINNDFDIYNKIKITQAHFEKKWPRRLVVKDIWFSSRRSRVRIPPGSPSVFQTS